MSYQTSPLERELMAKSKLFELIPKDPSASYMAELYTQIFGMEKRYSKLYGDFKDIPLTHPSLGQALENSGKSLNNVGSEWQTQERKKSLCDGLSRGLKLDLKSYLGAIITQAEKSFQQHSSLTGSVRNSMSRDVRKKRQTAYRRMLYSEVDRRYTSDNDSIHQLVPSVHTMLWPNRCSYNGDILDSRSPIHKRSLPRTIMKPNASSKRNRVVKSICDPLIPDSIKNDLIQSCKFLELLPDKPDPVFMAQMYSDVFSASYDGVRAEGVIINTDNSETRTDLTRCGQALRMVGSDWPNWPRYCSRPSRMRDGERPATKYYVKDLISTALKSFLASERLKRTLCQSIKISAKRVVRYREIIMAEIDSRFVDETSDIHVFGSRVHKMLWPELSENSVNNRASVKARSKKSGVGRTKRSPWEGSSRHCLPPATVRGSTTDGNSPSSPDVDTPLTGVTHDDPMGLTDDTDSDSLFDDTWLRDNLPDIESVVTSGDLTDIALILTLEGEKDSYYGSGANGTANLMNVITYGVLGEDDVSMTDPW